jgi:hypothetical protein
MFRELASRFDFVAEQVCAIIEENIDEKAIRGQLHSLWPEEMYEEVS